MINFKLIPAADFVILKSAEMYEKVQNKIDNAVLQYITVTPNYANFLKQDTAVWMFIPCNKSGKPLKKPIHFDVSFRFSNQELCISN